MGPKLKFQPRGKLISKGHATFVPWVTPLWIWHANMMSQAEVKQKEKPDAQESTGVGACGIEDIVPLGSSHALHTLSFSAR